MADLRHRSRPHPPSAHSTGSTTLIARDARTMIGLVHVQSDGEIQAYLSLLVVARDVRGRGLGTRLLNHAFQQAAGIHIDLLSRAGPYYLSLGAEPVPGFRLSRTRARPQPR